MCFFSVQVSYYGSQSGSGPKFGKNNVRVYFPDWACSPPPPHPDHRPLPDKILIAQQQAQSPLRSTADR